MAKVVYSPAARADMVEIRNYIRDELQNPAAAERVLTRIAKSLRLLEDAPRIGSPLSSVIDIDTEYRFLISGNYLSFYRYYDDTCYIDRILYRRRDYISILFGIDAEPDET